MLTTQLNDAGNNEKSRISGFVLDEREFYRDVGVLEVGAADDACLKSHGCVTY